MLRNWMRRSNGCSGNWIGRSASGAMMFDAMAKAEHGYKQAYYRYCMRQVQSASMYDNAEISVLTYEQFLEQA